MGAKESNASISNIKCKPYLVLIRKQQNTRSGVLSANCKTDKITLAVMS